MSNDHDQQHDVTQGENPGAQGDFGAGQGNPADENIPGEDSPTIVGVEQPRRDELDDDDADADFGGDLNSGNQV
jgi:hypothetical protein